MKTDKLLRVLTKNAPNRSGRALPLPKYQGPQQSQIGQSLTVAKEVPKELQDKYNSTQARIQALIDNPGQKENPGMAPKDVMEYIKDRSISTLMKENPSLGTTCQGPYCTTAASTAFRLTYPNAAPLPTTGGNTFRDQILQNPAFGVTSNDIYSNLHPGSYLQQQTLEEYYEDEEGNTKQRSKPSYQSTHNMYIYDVENLPSGRKRIHTVQNAGNLHNPESTQFTKAYDVDKEGNIYSQDSDHIVIESARANASDRPLLVYYKGNDVWANPEMNSLLKEREDYKNQILQIDPEYFMPEKPTRYDVDYKPGQFILPENFSSEQGKIVPSKNYKEFIDLRESKVSEIVDQVNNPEYKKMIMRDYNISDAEYNAAVKTMIGQYMMESQGGTDWQSGFRVPEHKGLAKFVTAFGKDLSKKSIGPFQINYDQLSDKTKAVIPKRGVSNKSKQEFVDFMYDPLKSSDIAMRYLAENIRTLRNWANQEGERQNMNSQNYLEFLPYMINQQGWLRRTDEESQSSKGSILGQGTNRYVQGIKEYGDMLLEHLPMSSDTLITNPPTVKPEQQRNGGPTASKAKEILRDGSVHGQPLTDEQKRYFGWIAGGKKQDGGSSTIDTTRPHAYVESPCGPGYVESTDENGNPICINPDTFNQQNSARIDAQRAAQAATMPADNNPSGNPSVSWDVNRDGPYPKNWYNNGPEDDLTSTFMSDCPECEQNSRRLDRRYRRMMRKNNPQPRVSNPIQIPEFTMPRLGIGRFFKNAIKNCRPGERCYTFEDGGPLGQYQGEQSQTGTEALFQKYYGQVDRYDVDPAGFDYYMYRNPEFQTLPPADRLALIKRMKNFLQYESGPRATQAEDVDTNTVFPDTPEQVDRRIRQNTKLQTNKDLTPKKPFGHGSYEYEDYKTGGRLDTYQGEQSQPGTKDNSQSIDWDRAWDKIKNPGKYPAMETPTLNNVLKLLFTPALFKDLPIFQEAPGKQIIYTKDGGPTKTLKVRIKKPK